MSKEEYWFKHASNAKDDPKCMLLIEELGLEGYGIFWVLIELLRDQPGYKANIRILPVIARRYNTTLEKIKMVIQRFDLFYVDQEELFFSPSLIRRMQPLDKMREAGRIGGKKSGEIRQLKAHSKGASKGASSTLEPTEQNRTEKNKEEEQKIPSLQQVKDYFVSNGYSVETAEKAYNYYNESVKGTKRKMWRDGKGNAIKNWKMKMRSVWFKPENEKNSSEPQPQYLTTYL